MTRDEIALRLGEIVRVRTAQEAPLSPDTELLGELQLDSVQQLELVVAIENEFEICLTPEDEQGLTTLGELAALVAQRLAEQREVAR
jgi:acyl carrier protein